ncbi:hypothetical protein, partial [Enterobacter cloacae complex sp. 4DZ3-28B]|uniref:hypothetical protein n=1 Tax=Enterobacter cloacae complex sp. 4DZ3-28B TaxID=2511989 RepID=UPI0021023AEA
ILYQGILKISAYPYQRYVVMKSVYLELGNLNVLYQQEKISFTYLSINAIWLMHNATQLQVYRAFI